jgi:small neutral amino acid transporter SnatA (MarC family)
MVKLVSAGVPLGLPLVGAPGAAAYAGDTGNMVNEDNKITIVNIVIAIFFCIYLKKRDVLFNYSAGFSVEK